MSDPVLLARTVGRLRHVPGFIAFDLDRYRRLTQVDPAADFDLPEVSLVTLGLCRRPRRNHYASDVVAIADKAGAQASAVANFLRASDAVTVLASRGETVSGSVADTRGLMAAARDRAEEHTVFEESDGRDLTLPGWLRHAVGRFWANADEDPVFPRGLHLPVLMNLPLAIIEIDGLTLGNLDEWLHRHHLPRLGDIADRPLRGCVVAYGGIGLLFVDRSDDPEQRRQTLAHEAGHFIVDYLIPRENVAQRRPELLDVLDGEREPTDAERFDALLADLPIGFHTHLLERDIRGGHLSEATTDVEDRAERLAFELLAPLQRVLAELSPTAEHEIPQLLQQRFGLPAGVATRYAGYIKRYRLRRPRTLLEAIGLTQPTDRNADTQSAGQPETET
ncbi:MAG: ImmA/IrrE family metallo-endopeptidase [Streptosporangiaceae bacterium]